MVYYVASVVVLYSAEAHTQRHYRGHTEDIESICVHPQVKSQFHWVLNIFGSEGYRQSQKSTDNLIARKHYVQPVRPLLLEMKTQHMSRSSVPLPYNFFLLLIIFIFVPQQI